MADGDAKWQGRRLEPEENRKVREVVEVVHPRLHTVEAICAAQDARAFNRAQAWYYIKYIGIACTALVGLSQVPAAWTILKAIIIAALGGK